MPRVGGSRRAWQVEQTSNEESADDDEEDTEEPQTKKLPKLASKEPLESRMSRQSLAAIEELLIEKRKREEAEKARVKAVEMQEAGLSAKSAQMLSVLKVDPNSFTGHRLLLHKALSHWIFDALIGLVIVSNAATLGVETQFVKTVPLGCSEDCDCTNQLDPTETCAMVPEIITILDNTFLIIYITELSLRLYTYRISVLKSNWIKFDAFLVFTSLVDVLFKMASEGEKGGDGAGAILETIMVVRVLRAAKLARALRLMVQFRTLWQLVQGLMHCLNTLLWTFILVAVMMCLFAIFGMELIKVDAELPLDHPYNLAASDNFTNLISAMLTILQVYSFDSIGGIYRPLIKHRGVPAFGFFVVAILVMSIALMNLVTAVMLNSALDQADEDKESRKAWEAVQKKKQMEQVKMMFKELDADGSGELDWDEIADSPEDIQQSLKDIAGTDDLKELFDILDFDGGGTVGVDEFCEGILKASNSAPGIIELGKLVKQCTEILKNTREVSDLLNDPEKDFQAYAKSVADGGEDGGGGGGARGGAAENEDLDRLEEKASQMEANLGGLQSATYQLTSLVGQMQARSMKSSFSPSSSKMNRF